MSFGSPFTTLPDFTYHSPRTLDDALALLKEHGDEAKVMGGGVGLIAFMKERLMSPSHVVDLKNIEELKQMRESDRGLWIGAAVSIAELVESKILRSDYSVLDEALSKVADPMIRRRATLVGNLCEAIPWVDSPPALMALDASVEVVSQGGSRSVPVSAFIKGPVEIDLEPEEIVTAVSIPAVRSRRSTFEKFTAGSEFSVASLAVAVSDGRRRTARAVYGSVNSTPSRCEAVESLLEGELTRSTVRKAALIAEEKVECVSDVLASSEYRKHLVKVITMRALGRLIEK